MRATLVLAALLLLGGCKLIDQETFGSTSEEPSTEATEAARVDTRAALVTIGYATPNPAYQEGLRYAVRTAEARSPGVQYDVVVALPAGGDAALAQQRASEVMRGIMAQGVAADRIRLGLRTVPAGPQEIRVYVR